MRLWRLSCLLLCALAACGGSIREEGKGGDEPAGSGGSGGSGGSSQSAYEQYCDARDAAVFEDCGKHIDVDRCKASADCSSMLLHGPGSPLFQCLLGFACDDGCIIEHYGPPLELTEAGKMFAERCSAKGDEGCGLYGDVFLAGALFTDEALGVMSACLDLAACEDVQACIDATYVRCISWLEPIF